MVVGFTTTCADSVYHHKSCEFKFHSWRGVLDATFVSDLQHVSGFRRVAKRETRRQSRHNTENLHKAILKFKKHRRDRGSNEKEIRKNVNIENIKIQSGLERVSAEIPSDLLTRQEHQSSQPVFGQVSATYLFSFLCCVLLVVF